MSKGRQTQRIVELTQGPEHHLLVPNQYRRSGPSVKRFGGCRLVVGRKGVYFGVPIKVSFGENALLRWNFAQKRQAKGWGHLMHAIRVVEREREPPILIHAGKTKRGRGRNKTKSFVLE